MKVCRYFVFALYKKYFIWYNVQRILYFTGRAYMTEKLYYDDPFLFEFNATVTEVTENGVVLDRTAFFPEG